MKAFLHDRSFCIQEQGTFSLLSHPSDISDDTTKKELKRSVKEDVEHIAEMQERFYAAGGHALLLIFQAMDAAGKDSCIRHVMSGVNPQGCHVTSFKAPSTEERAHDFIWRHAKAVPKRGFIGIHNRSHYEEVLVVKVHPTFILGQGLPQVRTLADIGPEFWEERYASIRNFESHLAEQGVAIMKFYLHMSREQQRQRFLERIDEQKKNWKFSMNDVREREHWDAYMNAYEAAIGATASEHAPWYIVPADEQWESRAIVARLVRERLEDLDPRFPELATDALNDLQQAREQLQSEPTFTAKQ